MDRCEAKRKEFARHRQCDENAQNVEDKLWENEELKNLEEVLPRLKESDLEKSWLHKAKTGVGCDSFHPKVPLDLTEEARGGWWKSWCGTKWEMAATSLYDDVFLNSANVTSERPIALMPTLIRW